MVEFLKLDFAKQLHYIDSTDRWSLDVEFKRTASNIFELQKGRRPKGHTDSISWVEFKNYRNDCKFLIEKLEVTISMYAVDMKTSNKTL